MWLLLAVILISGYFTRRRSNRQMEELFNPPPPPVTYIDTKEILDNLDKYDKTPSDYKAPTIQGRFSKASSHISPLTIERGK